MKINLKSFFALLLVAGLGIYLGSQLKTDTALGSVSRNSEYHATTTANGLWTSASENISSTTSQNNPLGNNGTLGSVVITGANTGIINIYDATTSDVTKRSAGLASTTVLLGSIPASAAAGTYTFDVAYRYGLIVQATSPQPTSTITWRE